MSQDDFFSLWAPRMQTLLRIVVGGLFLMHGSAKLLHVPHVASFDSVQLMSLIGFAGVLELVGGFLLLIGLFSRPAAFILSGEMAFAYFMAHGPRNILPILNGGELAVVYCFVFLYFAAAGGGPWSLDQRIGGRSQRLMRRTRVDASRVAPPMPVGHRRRFPGFAERADENAQRQP